MLVEKSEAVMTDMLDYNLKVKLVLGIVSDLVKLSNMELV